MRRRSRPEPPEYMGSRSWSGAETCRAGIWLDGGVADEAVGSSVLGMMGVVVVEAYVDGRGSKWV